MGDVFRALTAIRLVMPANSIDIAVYIRCNTRTHKIYPRNNYTTAVLEGKNTNVPTHQDNKHSHSLRNPIYPRQDRSARGSAPPPTSKAKSGWSSRIDSNPRQKYPAPCAILYTMIMDCTSPHKQAHHGKGYLPALVLQFRLLVCRKPPVRDPRRGAARARSRES